MSKILSIITEKVFRKMLVCHAGSLPPKCIGLFSYDKDIRTIFFSGQLQLMHLSYFHTKLYT